MMRKPLAGFFVFMIGCFASVAYQMQPASAQSDVVSLWIGDSAQKSQTQASDYAVYYAPYAIQAVATYAIRESEVNNAPSRVLSGVGINLAVKSGSGDYAFGDEQTTQDARNLLLAWQYEFGHDGQLGCLADDLPHEPTSPDDKCHKALQKLTWQPSGLAFDVWSLTNQRDACREVSIAFRGTFFKEDWYSDLRSVRQDSKMDDQYVQLSRNLDTILHHIRQLECYKRAGGNVRIVSVGHSLGGGLAQFAALAQPPSHDRRITKVFAFNPSPEAGIDLIDKTTLRRNRIGLSIDIIRQKGDGLGRVDATLQWLAAHSDWIPERWTPNLVEQALNPVIKPTACDPLVRSVEFDVASAPALTANSGQVDRALYHTSRKAYNAYQLHGMALLAANLVELSYDSSGDPVKPKAFGRTCPTDYDKQQFTPPSEDNEKARTSSRTPRPVVHAGPNFGAGQDFYAPIDYGSLPKSDRKFGRRPESRGKIAAARPLYASISPYGAAMQGNQ
jgi:pimeloyl-ACP methyl ester carboxylesterase